MSQDKNPLISTIMPVKNVEAYVLSAVQSIQVQTYPNWELLVIDDGCRDRTLEEVAKVQDQRIRVLSNRHAPGIVGAMNTGIEESRGELIARLDGDDLSTPDRFERQVALLIDEQDPTDFCGSWVKTFGTREEGYLYPLDHDSIRASLLMINPFAHSAVMFWKRVLQGEPLYHPEYLCAQDYELWERLARKCRMKNIGRFLVKSRVHSQQMTQVQSEQQSLEARLIRKRALSQIGISWPLEKQWIHDQISHLYTKEPVRVLSGLLSWYDEIVEANQKAVLFDQRILKQTLLRQALAFLKTCSAHRSSEAVRLMSRDPLEMLRVVTQVGFRKLQTRILM